MKGQAMDQQLTVEVQAFGLVKRYGGKVAVNKLSFSLKPGKITGFLGPNGAGKTTTMQLMLGLIHGEGFTLFGGESYRALEVPGRVVGAMLDSRPFHPTRTARQHLRMMAASVGAPDRRVDQMLEQVGLSSVADQRPSSFSLGMAQRLGLAQALLGDPRVLILDEPANGLDPQGIAWLRELLRAFVAGGRTAFVSSHLLAEMQEMADRVLVIGRGALIADSSLEDCMARGARHPDVLVRSPDASSLAGLLSAQGLAVQRAGDGRVQVAGTTTDQVGAVAFQNDIRVDELTEEHASLEDAFLETTSGRGDYDGRPPQQILSRS
jgi:ABC-2 type transport system ATP-binding protein